jgi:succinoglycan biosynthesis protein ExoA
MPLVSVIIPCYNEEATISLLLNALWQQTFLREEMEVIIADGMSTDRTRQEIISFQQTHPELSILIVDNVKRIIPAGLNRALDCAHGEFIVRLDGHSVPSPDYIARCVESLEKEKGDNVGGVWEIHPADEGWIARSIAIAASHPLGVGDAFYRFADTPGSVDTVPFGSFRRSLIKQIGPFNEDLLTNEDYEFNVRIRQNGGTVWMDPAIRSIYYARPNLSALAQQYWRYGYWKARMILRYPGTLRWRQGLPPLFVLSLIGLTFFSIFSLLARWCLMIEVLMYLAALLIASAQTAVKKQDPLLIFGTPLAIGVMHVTWGCAFIWSLFSSLFKK